MFHLSYDVFTQSNGEALSPIQGDPLAGLEGLSKGQVLMLVTAACSSDLSDACAKFDVQHFGPSLVPGVPGDLLDAITFSVPVSDTRQIWVLFKVEQGDSIAVAPTRNIVGTVSVALNYQPLLG